VIEGGFLMVKPQQAGLKGCHVLFITPLNKDYSLNEQAVRDEVEWCIQNGAHGIWPGGYIGEWTVILG
jgi:dihydrodipicolinate synthase/N-acetylneuraminate lyase